MITFKEYVFETMLGSDIKSLEDKLKSTSDEFLHKLILRQKKIKSEKLSK